MSFDKKKYQKEFMRKRRAKRGESNLPVPVDRATLGNELPEAQPRNVSSSQERESSDAGVSVPNMREREIAGLEAEKQEMVENQTESQKESKSSIGRSDEKWNDPETEVLPQVRERSSESRTSRPPHRLHRKISSRMAMSKVPSTDTFARDLVLAEPCTDRVIRTSGSGEARESTADKSVAALKADVMGSRGGRTFSYLWDKEKYPNRKAWEVAVVRAERAEKYARMFPQFIREEDLKYQTVKWQYQNEGIKAVKKPSTHFVPS